MDAHDIFHKLTRGAHFTKRNTATKRKDPGHISSQFNSDHNGNVNGEVKVKTEKLEHEDEDIADETEFELLSGVGYVEGSAKKKKKSLLDPEAKKELAEVERINSLRKQHRISVIGKNVPPPIETFDQLESEYNVSSTLVRNMLACNYSSPTPIQMQAIPVMMSSRPLLAFAPTGSGKTVAFLTPILRDLKEPQKKGFRALILCPTRELARQTYRECVRIAEKTGLKIHIISKATQAEQKFGANSNKKFDILISTPNRVRYLLQQEPPVLDLSNIEWFIIDEADRLMEDGQNNFKEQFDDILNACTSQKKKLALFSATYTVPVAKWAIKHLKGLVRVTVGMHNSATDLVEQELLFVGNESGKLLAFRDLVRNGLRPPVLVFVQSKERAKQLFDELIYDGINVDVIHAGRTQQQRDNVVRAFREGKIWVLICTELMGRGIDFKGVNLVINYDFPPTSIAYIHRIGRAGRAGRPGKAITYFTQDDTTNLRSIAQIIKNSGGSVPDFMLALKKTRKTERKKLANFAQKRDDITTIPKFELERREKLKKARELESRKEGKKESSENGESKKNKKDVMKKKKVVKKENSFDKSNGKIKEKKIKKRISMK